MKTKVKLIILLIIGIVALPIHYINFKSLQDQVFLYVDYNNFQHNLRTPLELVEKFPHKFPTLTNVAMPISLAKANYYIQYEDYETALELIEYGMKDNPYFYMGEYQKAKIYFRKKEYDKARYFGKIAFDNMPNNDSHVTLYQKILGTMKDVDELKRVFNLTKHNYNVAVWSNHLYALSALGHVNKVYPDSLKKLAKEAAKLFPNNTLIAGSDKVINYGLDVVYLADQYDILANEFFNKKEYRKAIEEWEKALTLIDNDDAYYLNIARSLSLLKKYKESNTYLDEIEKKQLNSDNGMLEFQKGLNFIELQRTMLACQYLKKSMELGYNQGIRAYGLYKCY